MVILLLNSFVDSKNWTLNIEKKLQIYHFLKLVKNLKPLQSFYCHLSPKFRIASDSPRQSQTYQTCKKQLLLEEIRIKKKKLKTLVTELLVVKEELLCSASVLDINHFFNLIVSSIKKSILKCRHVQHK